MPVPSRRPARPGRVRARALPLVTLVAVVAGLLAGPAVTGGDTGSARAAQRTSSVARPTQDDSVLAALAWLQGRVSPDTHLVNAPARTVKVRRTVVKRVGHKTVTRVRWVRRSVPGAVRPSASIDVIMALRRLDPGGTTQTVMARALQPEAEDFVQWRFGPFVGRRADASARMLSVAASSGVPLRRYADGSLRRALTRMVVTRKKDPQRGRVVDSGWGGDTSDTISQALAVQALAAVDSKYLPLAARFLAKQSCLLGFFRREMDSPDYTCRGSKAPRNRVSDVEATARAVLALNAARAHGVQRLDPVISAASLWLRARVRPNGAVVDHGDVNSLTTAWAALALRATGRLGAAGNAAAWLRRLQVDDRMIRRHPALRGLRGAITWDRDALAHAQRKGLTRLQRKRWVISTALAAPGLTALLPPRTLGVSGHNGRRRLVVAVSGLAAGEKFVLRRGGRVLYAGTAAARGVARVRLHKAHGDVRIRVVGSRPERAGVTVVSSR